MVDDAVRELMCAPENELLHTPVGEPSLPWKDTWYFSLFDEANAVHLNMHMTVSANRNPDTRVSVGVRAGARERVVVRREDGTHTDTSIGNSLARVEFVNLSWAGDHTVRWRAEGDDFSFDVTVTGVHIAPFFDVLFPGVNPTGKIGHSYSHVEQVIRGRGTLRWADGSEQEIDGFGWRDRGWGRRKSELSFDSGYDLLAGILPDGTAFALTGMRNVEHGRDAELPIYGFLTDGQTVVPAVGGTYYKDSMSFPARLDLEFSDGRRVAGTQVRRTSTLGTPFHEAEPESVGIAHGARDYYAVLADPGGTEFGVFSNEGHMLRVDVTRGGKFFHRALAPAQG
jgi:hypothetical protein